MTAPTADWLGLERGRPFFGALLDGESKYAWKADDMLLLMAGECDLCLGIPPNRFGYCGLTQIGKKQLDALGWEAGDGPFHKSPAEVQVEFAGRYFDDWRHRLRIARWESAGALWQCNLMPATLQTAGAPVFSKVKWREGYDANAWLDLNHDGLVTTDELTRALLKVAIPRSEPRYTIAMRNLAVVRAERTTRTKKPSQAPPAPDMRDPNLSEIGFGPPPDDVA